MTSSHGSRSGSRSGSKNRGISISIVNISITSITTVTTLNPHIDIVAAQPVPKGSRLGRDTHIKPPLPRQGHAETKGPLGPQEEDARGAAAALHVVPVRGSDAMPGRLDGAAEHNHGVVPGGHVDEPAVVQLALQADEAVPAGRLVDEGDDGQILMGAHAQGFPLGDPLGRHVGKVPQPQQRLAAVEEGVHGAVGFLGAGRLENHARDLPTRARHAVKVVLPEEAEGLSLGKRLSATPME